MKLSFVLIILILSVGNLTFADNFCHSLFETEKVSGIETFKVGLPKEKIRELLKTDPTYFDNGKFKDQIVNQNKFRPVERITELETEMHFFVKNYTHHGKFWIARIPKNSIRDMIFQLSLFDGPLGKQLGHAQMRFITKEPVHLFRLDDLGKVVYTEVRDFNFAFEAAMPTGSKYNGIDALLRRYKITSRLISTFDRNFSEQIMDGDTIRQFRLIGLNPELMLQNSIDLATDKKLDFAYNTAKANCINYLFDIIDTTLEKKYPRVETTLPRLLFNGPNPILKLVMQALEVRNLLGPKSQLPDYYRKHKTRAEE